MEDIQKKISALHTEYITLKFGQGKNDIIANRLTLTSESNNFFLI